MKRQGYVSTARHGNVAGDTRKKTPESSSLYVVTIRLVFLATFQSFSAHFQSLQFFIIRKLFKKSLLEGRKNYFAIHFKNIATLKAYDNIKSAGGNA